MKAKIKSDLNEIVEKTVEDYKSITVDEKSKVLGSLIKEVNVIKDIETQEIDNSIKKKRLKLDEEKLMFEKEKMNLEKEKFNHELNKFEKTIEIDSRKLNIEESKLELEKYKLTKEYKKAKADRIVNNIIKGLEIGVPLVINTGLTLMLFRLIYKDDGRAPSELKDLMRHVYKK